MRSDRSPSSSSSEDVIITIFASGWRGEDLARRGDAVRAGHEQVHQDDVGLVVQAELDGLAAAAGLGDHDDPGALQHITQHPPYERIVIRDYHAQGCARLQSIASVHLTVNRTGPETVGSNFGCRSAELGADDQRTA